MSEDLLQDQADETNGFDAFEDTGDLSDDSAERVVHVDDGNYGPTDDEDLSEVPPQSLDEVIDELHEHDETILAPISEQLKKAAGELLSPIALQGVSRHAKKRPISALDDRWLQSTWERISGLLGEQPDADEAPDWKHDVRLLEAAAEERELDLWAPAQDHSRMADEIVRKPNEVVMLALAEIEPDPAQARDEGADDELADLIKANGFYDSKPIEVRRTPAPYAKPYMIVDGERRYRGALKAGLTHVPAMIVEAPDEGERLLRQVNSNQGKPLKPMEEARAYKRIMVAHDWTIQQLASHLGKSKSTVSDRVAMAEAPERFQQFFVDGTLSAAAAPIVRQIAALPDDVQDKIVKHATSSWDWRQYAEKAQTIPANKVLGMLAPDGWTFPPVEGIGKEFAGATFEFKGKRHARDRAQYLAFVEKKQRGDKPATVAVDKYAEQRAREDKKKREARARKLALRTAHFAAVSAKLPPRMDEDATLLVVEALAREMQQLTQIAACKALGIMPERKSTYGPDFKKLIIGHAKEQGWAGRTKILLQLAMAGDLQVSEWSESPADRIAAAAKLARVDLKKVKLPAPANGKSPRDVPCPECKAKVGSPCKRPSGHTVFGGGFHAARKV